MVENAKKCRLYPTFPYLYFSLKNFALNISKTRANFAKTECIFGFSDLNIT